MTEYIDLHAPSGSKDIADFAKRLGWARAVAPAEVREKNVQEAARRLRKDAEVIIASGSDDINRLASDSWEVDIIGSPEVHEEGDFMHQLNSGVDYVIAKACAEKGIAVEFNFANVLSTYGRRRAQVMARMAQNVRICRDCDCGMVITSGARDKFGLRGPQELASFGVLLGMSPAEAKRAVSENPEKILKKTRDRKDPNIITRGLEVKKWGSKPKEKKTHGWY